MKEIWKDVKGYEGSYQVSNLGRAKSLDRTVKRRTSYMNIKGRILKDCISRDYSCIGINGKLKSLHRLITIAFIPNPYNKTTVNHINGIKSDNRVLNLEWATQSENDKHAYRIGLKKPLRGSLNGMTKLTQEDVNYFRYKKRTGGFFWGCKSIAKEYNISEDYLRKIVNNRVDIWQ